VTVIERIDTNEERQSRTGRKLYSVGVRLALVAIAAAVVVPLGRQALRQRSQRSDTAVAGLPAPVLTPWAGVGGCGAGGSGGGGGGGAKWVGMGVSGGLIDAQIMYTATIGQSYRNGSVSVRLSGKPHWKVSLGASIPYNHKDGQYQYQTNIPPEYAITGGIGDVSVDLGLTFGATGQFSGTFGLSMPTGQYDIKRGTDNATFYLPASLQNGTGLWNGSFTLGYSKDVEDGILLFDFGYSHPFAMRLITGENEFLDLYYPDGVPEAAKDNPRYYYRFKWYGENDMGAYSPPSLSASMFYGYRGVHGYVHSFGVSFSAPLGVARMHFYDPSTYAPVPDPDHQAWSGAFNYGIEFSRRKFPIFISVVKPIHDKSSPDAPWEWNQPDWKDFLHSWSAAIGVKTTMF
jgi:hypothetical protein